MIETALATASGTVDQSETADVLLARLAAVPRVRATLDELERETALLARETPSATRDGNVTWAEIGKAFGITPEAAKYRFDGGNQRRKERDAAANEEPLVGESIATVAEREGVSPTTFRKRAAAGAYPQYRLVETVYRGRPATRVETV